MPFYVADYLADTGHLSAAENGAYLLLIMHYWRTGGLPDDGEMRRRVSRMTHREWQRSSATVLGFFSIDGKHKRIDEVLSRANHKSSVLRDNALKSHDARRANAQQEHLPNDCISEPEPKKKEKEATASSSTVVDLKASKALARVEGDQRLLDRITDGWNAWAASHGSPQVRYLTGQRSIHCRRRINDLLCGAPIEEAETVFSRLLTACEQSFFVRGNPRSPLKFDQLMNEGFMVKMMEGAFTYVPERKSSWRA